MLTKKFAIGLLAGVWGVSQCLIERVGCYEWTGFTEGIGAVTGPTVLLGNFDHGGANRIELDVALAGEQIGFLLHNAGPVAAFPEGAAALINPVHILDIPLPQAFHEHACAGGLGGSEQQVYMVGHEHIGMDDAIAHVAVFLEPFQITTIVFVGKKAGLAIVAALDDMQRDVGGGESRSSWHDDYLPLIFGVIQEKTGTKPQNRNRKTGLNRGQTTFFCSINNEQKNVVCPRFYARFYGFNG